MNDYTMETIQIGDSAVFTHRVEEQWLKQFLDLSGDNNPLHTDAAFARSQGFRDRVVYGMCTASLYSTLAGVYLPGKYCLLERVDAKFVKPVFVGDELKVSGTVTAVDRRFGRAEIKADIRNGAGEKVSRANITVGFLQEVAEEKQ